MKHVFKSDHASCVKALWLLILTGKHVIAIEFYLLRQSNRRNSTAIKVNFDMETHGGG